MEIFVHRNPVGTITSDLKDVLELEDQLKMCEYFPTLDDKSEIHLEISGTWKEIKELLSQPCFKECWEK